MNTVNALKPNTYELSVKSNTSQLAAIREFIQKYALLNSVPQSVIESIILAVDEAATNIVKHAYHSNTDQDIIIRLSCDGKQCVVSLIDYGDSFDPASIPNPDMKEYLQQRKVGGLGVYLMRTLMDGIDYQSFEGDCNRLTLVKRYA